MYDIEMSLFYIKNLRLVKDMSFSSFTEGSKLSPNGDLAIRKTGICWKIYIVKMGAPNISQD